MHKTLDNITTDGYKQGRQFLRQEIDGNMCYCIQGLILDQMGVEWKEQAPLSHPGAYGCESSLGVTIMDADTTEELGLDRTMDATYKFLEEDGHLIGSRVTVADLISEHNDAGFSLEFCLRLARTYARKP